MPVQDPDFAPEHLVTTKTEARLLVAGVGLFAVGLVMFGASAVMDSKGASIIGLSPGMVGVLLLDALTKRVARRLRPAERRRWWFESRLGTQWTRPSVVRRGFDVLRSRP